MEHADEKNWKEVKKLWSTGGRKIESGIYWNYLIHSDIKHVSFTLSRYKFASKLLMYRKNLTVLELGCNEAWGALMLQQNTNLKRYLGVDLDSEAIEYNKNNLSDDFEFLETNFFDMKLNEHFDAVISLDVIEHVDPKMEDAFAEVVERHCSDDGTAIIGTPNSAMTPYACEGSRVGHINLYDQNRLYQLFSRYFNNVFIFNMNDEVVHTGFNPMSCYIFAVCTGKKIKD